jgi:hypothetical protein
MRPVFSLLLSAIDDTAIEQELLPDDGEPHSERERVEQRAEQRAARKWQSLFGGALLAELPDDLKVA